MQEISLTWFKRLQKRLRKYLSVTFGVGSLIAVTEPQKTRNRYKLPQDPQLHKQVLSDLADCHLVKHNPDWSLMKDVEALLELALSTESIIRCVSN